MERVHRATSANRAAEVPRPRHVLLRRHPRGGAHLHRGGRPGRRYRRGSWS